MNNKTKVLVADDERVIANTLAIILQHAGFEALAVYRGEEAVELARTFQPDILISDVVMAMMTGIEAAIQICTVLPACRILLFSGQADTADLLEDARQRNYDFDLLAKPIHPLVLLNKLRKRDLKRTA
jgi:CheY-like chemotaxis protein